MSYEEQAIIFLSSKAKQIDIAKLQQKTYFTTLPSA